MREIKFRAWDSKEKKWFKPIYEAYLGRLEDMLISLKGDILIHGDISKGETDVIRHESLPDLKDRYILQQFTGLLDKNGEEIYFDDLCSFEEGIYRIVWNDTLFCLQAILVTGYGAMSIIGEKLKNIVVIGNIYENPELTTDIGEKK